MDDLKTIKSVFAKKNLLLSLLIRFATASFAITSASYITSTFLRTFASSTLTYLFALQAIGSFCFSYLAIFLIKRIAPKKAYTSIFIAFLIALLIIILGIHHLGTIFVFTACIIIFSMNTSLGTVSWNLVDNALTLQELKYYANIIALSASLGSCLFGIMEFFIIKYIGVDVLSIFLALLLIIIFFCGKNFLESPEEQKVEVKDAKHFKYKLLQYLLMYVIVIPLLFIIVDFNFKTELAKYFSADHFFGKEIAEYMVLLTSVTGLCSLPLIYYFCGLTLEYFGTKALFMALPVAWIICAFFIALFPGIITTTAAMTAYLLFNFSFTGMGKQLVLSAMPPQVKLTERFFLDIYAVPLGYLLGALTLFFIHLKISTLYQIGIILLGSGGLIWLSFYINSAYTEILISSIKLQRLDWNISFKNFYGIIFNQLLSSLTKHKLTNEYLSDLLNLMHDSNPTINNSILDIFNKLSAQQKIMALNFFVEKKQNMLSDRLFQLYLKEKDALVRYKLLNYISIKKPNLLTPILNELEQSKDLSLVLIALRVKLINSDSKDQAFLLAKMQEIYTLAAADQKILITSIIAYLPLNIVNPFIKPLIEQAENDNISILAMKAAQEQKLLQYTPSIIAQLYNIKRLPFAYHNLSLLGYAIIQNLSKALVDTKKYTVIFRLITLLIKANNKDALRFVLDYYALAKNPMVHLHIAKAIAENINYELIDTEIKLTIEKYLLFISSVYYNNVLTYLTEDSSAINEEIMNRVEIMRKTFIYFISVYMKNFTILEVIPAYFNKENSEKKFFAIESLDSIVDYRIRAMLPFLDNISSKFQEAPLNDIDPLLFEIIQANLTTEGNKMESIAKVKRLREVDIFNNLPAEALIIIADHTMIKEFYSNQIIFSAKDSTDGAYILDSGKILIPELNKIISKPGELFGEVGVLSDSTRLNSAVCQTDVVCYFIDKKNFMGIFYDLPEISVNIIKKLISYLQEKI